MGKSKFFVIMITIWIMNGIHGYSLAQFTQKSDKLPKERICYRQRCHRYFKI